MNQRLKVTLVAAASGAAIGVLATRTRTDFSLIPPSARDQALLAHSPFLLAGILGWVAFSLYWEIAAKNAAAAKTSESKGSRAVHVFLANAALLLEIVPIRGLGRFLPAASLIMTAGLAVEALGLCLTIWARRHLGRNWSGEITIKVDHQLIRSGPYKLLRHPIYTGLLTMYAGIAIVTGEWLAIVGFAMAAFAYWRKIRLEEANLRVAFGAEYESYRRDTWALLPGLF
ncbi:MAG: isoprenylcysteine carboxylmethyltransferase family protein [Bryobacteraceae bacterium]|jgi:protein-S-isoprenylcysteine O-methyltransferase Ste14